MRIFLLIERALPAGRQRAGITAKDGPYNIAGLKYAPRDERGKNFSIFDQVDFGTYSMSPGCSTVSSFRFLPFKTSFRFRTLISTQSSEFDFRNSTTCEFFAPSANPPAIATACVAVVVPRRSYLPGLPTSPPATKYGRSKSFKVTLISGSFRMLEYAF